MRKWRTEKREEYLAYTRARQGLPLPARPMPEFCEADCGRKAKHLDHDRETGKFRGWLCGPCNRGLGQIGDTTKAVLRMLVYVSGANNGALPKGAASAA